MAEMLRFLVPGGRLICVVGDVCLSRRKNEGRHTVVPLHASIQDRCRKIGFDNLAPIIWHKIANAVYEVDNGNGGFLGKPYEPNAVIKNDIEFILMEGSRADTARRSRDPPFERYPIRRPQDLVSTDLDRADRSFDSVSSGAIPSRTGRAADQDVLLRWRYGAGPIPGHRNKTLSQP